MVIEKICEYFGVKHISPALIGGSKYLAGENPSYLQTMAKELIANQKIFQKYLETVRKNIQQDDSPKKEPPNGTTHNKFSQTNNSQNVTDADMDVEIGEKYRNAVIEISKKFADKLQCESSSDFIKYLKFICIFIREEFMKHKENYDNALQTAREISPDVTLQEFDRKYGIQNNYNEYFFQQVMNDFEVGSGFIKLRNACEGQKTLSAAEEAAEKAAEEAAEKAFEDAAEEAAEKAAEEAAEEAAEKAAEEAVETTFMLHEDGNFKVIAIENEKGLAPDGWLNRDQYFGIAEKLTEEQASETNVVLEEDAGTAVMIIGEVEKIINVTTQKQEDTKIFGIALMITAPEEYKGSSERTDDADE